MKRIRNLCLAMSLLLILCWIGMQIADKATLRKELIRLHVVANSDSAEDQAVKLQVRDAVVEFLDAKLSAAESAQVAAREITCMIDEIEEIANETLMREGFSQHVQISLCEEEFPIRHYETFTLPSGIYKSLRITIGNGEGQNWWCVVFPNICLKGAAVPAVEEVDAGFSDELVGAITGQEEYRFSFFFLECLGRIENFLNFS